MRHHRPQRISSLLREELNKLILRYIEMPVGSLVTITEIKVLDDLSEAIVKFSTIPSEKSEEALKILDKAKFDLQYKLLKKMRIKNVPKLSFQIDHGMEHAAKIEKALMEEKNN